MLRWTLHCCWVDRGERSTRLPWPPSQWGHGMRGAKEPGCAQRARTLLVHGGRARVQALAPPIKDAHEGVEMRSTYPSAYHTRHARGSALAHLPAEPQGCTSRPPSKVDIEQLQMLFEQPQPEAAKRLGISLTTLKQVCRRLGVSRWPYRRSSKACKKSRPRPDVETPQGAGSAGLAMNQLTPASSLPPLPMPTIFQRPGRFQDGAPNGHGKLLDREARDAAGAWAHGSSPMKFAGINAGTGVPYWPAQGIAAAERMGLMHAGSQAHGSDPHGFADFPAPEFMSSGQPQLQALSRGYHPGTHNRMPWPTGSSPSNVHDPTVQNAHLGRLRLDPRIDALGCYPNGDGMGPSGPAQYQGAGGWTMDQEWARSQDSSARGLLQAGSFSRGRDAEHRSYVNLSFAEQGGHWMGLGWEAADGGHRMGLSGAAAEHGGRCHRMGLGGVAAGVSARSYLASGDQRATVPDLRMVGGGIGREFRAGNGNGNGGCNDNAFLRPGRGGQSAPGSTMTDSAMMPLDVDANGQSSNGQSRERGPESFGDADTDSQPLFNGATGMPLPRELGIDNWNGYHGRQNPAFGGAGLGWGTFNPDM